jgi:carboxyl-terminal processing protease
VIQQSIARSRKIREQLEKDQSQLLTTHKHGQKEILTSSTENSVSFAKTEAELKSRNLDQLRLYVSLERKKLGDTTFLKREKQLLANFELNLRGFEDRYLYENGQGQTFSTSEKENLFIMHVIKSLASSLDAHTRFYDPQEAYDMRVRLEKEFKGVGIVFEETKDGILIASLTPGGPAEKNGLLKIHDKIEKIDGKSVAGLPLDEFIKLIHKDNGPSLTLDVQQLIREGEKTLYKPISVTLNKEEILLNDDRAKVSYETFGNGIIGKITLNSFYRGENGLSSEEDVREGLKTLSKQGSLRGLVLDLRENSGGFLTQAVKVAGLFITDGVVVMSKYSNGEEHIYRDIDGRATYDGPLVILTSKGTASAAEIVAQALQDYGVGLVVGDERTYGKGTIQSQTVTGNNDSSPYFKVTIGKYYTVSGKTPQIQGVKADILVPSKYAHDQIGEEYLENSIHEDPTKDTVPSAFTDNLQDVDPSLKPWYIKYYAPHLQHRVQFWKGMVPTLKQNSTYRISHNKNYQLFLKGVLPDELAGDDDPIDADDELSPLNQNKNNYGRDDLQMGEAINIVKDMAYLQTKNLGLHNTSTLMTSDSKDKN